ncbi:hypothetical protein CQW23_18494 [Capsicum baccatum]|uniref:Uncharacterized protein n=1 Tax=Capsicum baccatum TaxID=33114 RepID=A0A2G2W336_CAPBA|nr:hypothetical protein CQW23_18494 [Capsicum baccatum]
MMEIMPRGDLKEVLIACAKLGRPPRIRITGTDDSISAYARGGGIEIVGRRLSSVAASCNIPFEFHLVAASCSDVEIKHLNIRPGSRIRSEGFRSLAEGESVEYEVENGSDRCTKAVGVTGPDGAAVSGGSRSGGGGGSRGGGGYGGDRGGSRGYGGGDSGYCKSNQQLVNQFLLG